MQDKQTSRRQEIMTAALYEFSREGISGARMQSIADNIGVTKAMIHYYFKTKKNLFKEVFEYATRKLMGKIMEVLEKDIPLFQKIEQFIDQTIDQFNKNPELVGFVTGELNRHPKITDDIFNDVTAYSAATLKEQLETASSNYEIAPVNHNQVVANILSLCMFPYSGQRFLQGLLSIQDSDNYAQFLEQRREVIKDTIINWLAG